MRNEMMCWVQQFDHTEHYGNYRFPLRGFAQHANGATPYRTTWQANGRAKTNGEYRSDIMWVEITLEV
jgi:hypothetical protein